MTRAQSLQRMGKLQDFPYFTKNSTELKYLIDYRGSNGYLVVFSKNDFLFFTDARYIQDYSRKIGEDKVRLIKNNYAAFPWQEVFSELQERQISNLFVDYNHFFYKEMLDMQKDLTSRAISLQNLSLPLDRIRLVKEEAEILLIKKSQEINEKAFATVIGMLKEGVSEQDLSAEFEYIVKKQGAQGTSFNSIIVFGENSADPHGVPSNRKLKNGDVVLIDAGVLYENYCSDMTRTLCFGNPKDESFKENYQILLKAQKDCLALIEKTEKYGALDLFVRDELKKHHLDSYFTHSLGHGVGIDIHEIPRIFYQKMEESIEVGHVFTVEPGIYLEGRYGIRIEDMITIKPGKKVEILSSFPKELKIL